AQAAESHPRPRCRQLLPGRGGGLHPLAGTTGGGGGRPLLSAEHRLPGELSDRRQPLDQRRRRQRAALWNDARPGARARGGAARRALARGALDAAQGQYRLRHQVAVSRRRGHPRRDHRHELQAVPAAAGPRDRARGAVRDAVLTRSERERAALWKLRESIPEAQRHEGASLKHDISLPVAALPDFVARAAPWISANVPDGRLVAYGHVGDGNLHFNVSQLPGADRERFLARADGVRRAVHDLVREFGGSFSAEHGIGVLKVGELERYASPVELELMRAVKRAFDP